MNHGLIAALALGLTAAAPAIADDDLWFGVKAGTLGLGLEATWRPIPYLDLRAGLNRFSYDDDRSEAGIDYDAELDLASYYLTANLRAPATPFRFTAGIFSNGNEVGLSSRESAVFEIGGETYTAAQVGVLRGTMDVDRTAPYAGIGFDFRIADTLGLNLDLGVLWQGSPTVDLRASGPIAGDPDFQRQLEDERAQLEDELEDFELYPVASIGFSWNF